MLRPVAALGVALLLCVCSSGGEDVPDTGGTTSARAGGSAATNPPEISLGGDYDAEVGLVATYAPGVTNEDTADVGEALVERFGNVGAQQDDDRPLIRFGARTSRKRIADQAAELQADPDFCRVVLVELARPGQELDAPRVPCP